MLDGLRVALNLLDWLDEQGLDLASLTQHHIDSWLAEPIDSRRCHLARDFLKWAVSKRLAPRTVSIPPMKVGEPKTFADSEDYTQQPRRCLHDEDVPADMPVFRHGRWVLLTDDGLVTPIDPPVGGDERFLDLICRGSGFAEIAAGS